jgi:hypothetical protein
VSLWKGGAVCIPVSDLSDYFGASLTDVGFCQRGRADAETFQAAPIADIDSELDAYW